MANTPLDLLQSFLGEALPIPPVPPVVSSTTESTPLNKLMSQTSGPDPIYNLSRFNFTPCGLPLSELKPSFVKGFSREDSTKHRSDLSTFLDPSSIKELLDHVSNNVVNKVTNR